MARIAIILPTQMHFYYLHGLLALGQKSQKFAVANDHIDSVLALWQESQVFPLTYKQFYHIEHCLALVQVLQEFPSLLR